MAVPASSLVQPDTRNCHHCCENRLPSVVVTSAEREILGRKSKHACKASVENVPAYNEAQAVGAYRVIPQCLPQQLGDHCPSQLRSAFCPTRIVGPERRAEPLIGLPSTLKAADATGGQPLIITASPSPLSWVPSHSNPRHARTRCRRVQVDRTDRRRPVARSPRCPKLLPDELAMTLTR